MARYLPDGSLDESFGDSGKVITNLDDALSRRDIIKSLVLQPDGKIVAGGISTYVGNSDASKFALARYNPDGSPDAEFGSNGVVLTDFAPNDDELRDIALQDDGKIVAVGRVGSLFDFYGNMGVARYTSSGNLDESFGNGGKITIKFPSGISVAQSVELQQDEKILVAGIAGGFALVRFNTNGTIDPSFGDLGFVVTDMSGVGYEGINCLIQEDGKIILTGESIRYTEPRYNFALARYNGDPVENPIITKINTWIRNNMLGWYTTNNKNVNYYSIQHSNNGSNFTEETRVQAEKAPALIQYAQNHEKETYSYALKSAESGYYRIGVVMKNGSTVYSDVVAYNSTNNQLNNSTVTIYPNPVKNVLHVSGLNTSTNTTLTIVNAQGNVFKTASSTNNTSTDINVSSLKQGTYYLQVKDGEQSKTYPFMKE